MLLREGLQHQKTSDEWQMPRKKSFVGKYLTNLIYFPLPVNVYSDYCPSLQTAWKVFKQIQNYTV